MMQKVELKVRKQKKVETQQLLQKFVPSKKLKKLNKKSLLVFREKKMKELEKRRRMRKQKLRQKRLLNVH